MAYPGILQKLLDHISNKLVHTQQVIVTGDITGSGTPDAAGKIYISTTGINAANATRWSGANKTISYGGPGGGNDGDIWFQIL